MSEITLRVAVHQELETYRSGCRELKGDAIPEPTQSVCRIIESALVSLFDRSLLGKAVPYTWKSDRMLLYVDENTELEDDHIKIALPWLRRAIVCRPKASLVMFAVGSCMEPGSLRVQHTLRFVGCVSRISSVYVPQMLATPCYDLPLEYLSKNNSELFSILSCNSRVRRSAVVDIAEKSTVFYPKMQCEMAIAVVRDVLGTQSNTLTPRLIELGKRMTRVMRFELSVEDDDIIERSIYFYLISAGIVSRCMHIADPETPLHTKSRDAFVRFEREQLHIKLSKLCINEQATIEFVTEYFNPLNIVMFRVDIVPYESVGPLVKQTLECVLHFMARLDYTPQSVFRVKNFNVSYALLTSHRGVICNGEVFLTYHDVPLLLCSIFENRMRAFLSLLARHPDPMKDALPAAKTHVNELFEIVREKYANTNGRIKTRTAEDEQIVLPDIENLTGVAPLCMVNTLGFMVAERRLSHHSMVLLIRHLLDTGYSRTAVTKFFLSNVMDEERFKEYRYQVGWIDDRMGPESYFTNTCQYMMSQNFKPDLDGTRGCPYINATEEEIMTLLIISGITDVDAINRITAKALGTHDPAGKEHPKVACLMHAMASVEMRVGSRRITEREDFPIDSPASHIRLVLGQIQNARASMFDVADEE
jgi:DNA primase large subunit